MKRKTIIQAIFTTCLFFIPALLLSAQVIANRQADYSLDLPVNWQVLAQSDPARISWMSGDLSTSLKILVFDKDSYPDAVTLYNQLREQLEASGEGVEFFCGDYPAVLADLSFKSGALSMRGYSVFILGDSYAYALIAFSQLAQYERMHDAQLSALDSFATLTQGRLTPGPISCFLSQDQNDKIETYALKLAGEEYPLQVSRTQRQVSQDIIDREARILAGFENVNITAWHRFYRMLYRDNYQRLETLFKVVNHHFAKLEKKAKLSGILAWLQEFGYQRSGTVSDFTNPLDTVLRGKGDCDSLGLVYLILLHHLDVEAVLLVSDVFRHSAVGLGLEEYSALGAKVTVAGREYLFTELTTRVEPGMIVADMADPAGWIGFKLGGQ